MFQTIVTLSLLLFGISGYAATLKGYPDLDRLAERFAQENPGAAHDLQVQGKTIHYMTAGTPGMPKVIFVHGSPGEWKHFVQFMLDSELAAHSFMIAMDRPGYGGSNPGIAVPSLEKQAELLMPLLDTDVGSQKAILVGSSYGGGVVERMAMTADPRIASIVSAAGIADPDLDGKKWYQYIADWDWVKFLLPDELDVSNQECEIEKNDLVAMLPLWNRIQARVTVIQGLDDTTVPPENADFVGRQLERLRPMIERIPGLDHLISYRRPELIKAAVLTELNSI